MERKKWTPKVEVNDALLKFREKRKWQLALRRYVLEKNKSAGYAYFFGLGIERFREWIAIQFTDGINWENFGTAWQFDHIIPVAYFDFSIDEELILCWNFVNIRVVKISSEAMPAHRIDIIAAKSYFQHLYKATAFEICLKMILKIESLERSNLLPEPSIETFILKYKKELEKICLLDKEEFNYLNMGMSVEEVLIQKAFLQKFS